MNKKIDIEYFGFVWKQELCLHFLIILLKRYVIYFYMFSTNKYYFLIALFIHWIEYTILQAKLYFMEIQQDITQIIWFISLL
jgi:hypothetical protein